MKIISNFKDFYDFNNIYDTDDSIVYVRKKFNIDTKENEEILNKLVKSRITYNSAITYFNKKANNNLYYKVGEYIVGVYPFIYYIPILKIYQQGYNIYDGRLLGRVVLTKEKFYNLDKILEEVGKFTDKKFYIEPKLYSERRGRKYRRGLTYLDKIFENEDKWFYEDKELFSKLKTPVFVAYVSENNCNVTEAYGNVNISGFSNFVNIVTQNERDIYNDIENFFWSQKQEPITPPSNENKILSHGFDLKTSFRKCK